MNHIRIEIGLTELFHRFRFASRAIWNDSLWPGMDSDDAWILESFREAKKSLFKSMVEDKVDYLLDLPSVQGFQYIVVPGHERQAGERKGEVLMYSRPSHADPGADWVYPPIVVNANKTKLRYLDVVDKHQTGWLDLRYYLVRVEQSEEYPHLAGYEGLIDVYFCEIRVEPIL